MACGLVAACITAVVWGPMRLLSLVLPVLLPVTMAGTVWVLARPDAVPMARAGTHVKWWTMIGATCASIAVCLALTASASAVGVLLLLMALVLTSPPATQTALRYWRGHPGASGLPAGPETPAHAGRASMRPASAIGECTHVPSGHRERVMALSTMELCQVWRATYWLLRDSRDCTRTLGLVELRAAALDELEQRHPDAVHQWLASGHHAADGPSRYL